jgi:biopolymer transport protein ExbB
MARKIVMWVVFVFFIIYILLWLNSFMGVFGAQPANVSMVFRALAESQQGVKYNPEIENFENADKATGFAAMGVTVAKGGGLVDLLFFLLMLAIFFTIERLTVYLTNRGSMRLPVFLESIRTRFVANDIPGAKAVAKKQGGVFGRMVEAGLDRYDSIENRSDSGYVKSEVHEALEEAKSIESARLEQNLIALATIASIGTMTGLLGTVVGMIRAFSALASKGRPDPNKLATGISEALVNTAGGLVVAISTIIAYNYFTNRVDRYNFNMEECSTELTALVTKTKEG